MAGLLAILYGLMARLRGYLYWSGAGGALGAGGGVRRGSSGLLVARLRTRMSGRLLGLLRLLPRKARAW